MYEEAKANRRRRQILFGKTKVLKTKEEMVSFWEELASKYPIISLEDGVAEEDWGSMETSHRQAWQQDSASLVMTCLLPIPKGLQEELSLALLTPSLSRLTR